LSGPGSPVRVTRCVRFLAHGGRGTSLGRRKQFVSEMEIVIELLGSRVLLEDGGSTVDGIAEFLPAVGTLGREVIGRQQVRDLEPRGRWVGVENERVVRFAQKPGRVAVREVPTGAADRLGKQNMSG